MATKRIMYDSPEAATLQTVTGWVSSDGRFYGDNEHLARWAGCTHKKCDDCGSEMEIRAWCEPCRDKKKQEEFAAMQRKEWDGKAPLCLFDGDAYFFSEDEIEFYCESNDIKSEELRLVFCEPNFLHEIEPDTWSDIVPDDDDFWTPPDEVAAALSALNAAIKKAPAVSWFPGKVAAILPPVSE